MNIKQRLQQVKWLNHAYTSFKWRQRRLSWGRENEDKEFYVVRRADARVGLFSLVLTNLGHIRYALEKGCIPVVDMRNYESQYAGAGMSGQNMWEYYFEQPCHYDLESIGKSKRIILSNGLVTDKLDYPADSIAYEEKELQFWKALAKRYLRVNQSIADEAARLEKTLFEEKKILGVLARGTDYVHARPVNHPIQPTPRQLMEKIEEKMQERNCEKIYLATEDAGIFRKFKERYGDKLIAVEARRHETDGGENINDIRRREEKDGYTMGKEYLLTILLLARCDCLVAGNTSGTIGALLLNQEYEDKFIFNLGVYGKSGE